MKQAVILAGGKGTRLKQFLGEDLPKPMLRVGNKPVLEHQIQLLVDHGFRDVVLFTGYRSTAIEEYFGDGAKWGLKIRYQVEREPLGTAGAVLDGAELLQENFLVMYGDTMLNVDLDRFWQFHLSQNAGVSIFLHPNDHPYDSDLVALDGNGNVTGFFSYPHDPEMDYPNLVNAALYGMTKTALTNDAQDWTLNRRKLDFAKDLFPSWLKQGGSFKGYVSREYIKDMGTEDRLKKVERDFQSGKITRGSVQTPAPAVFIDRDGTLTKSLDYVRKPNELELLADSAQAIQKLNRSEMLAVVITNQPVVARGDVSEAGLKEIHNRLESLLGRDRAYLDAIYHCPHHPDRGFPNERPELKIRCSCRKPEIALIEKAACDLAIDLKRSWMIGDTTVDLLTARNAGLKSVLVRTGFGGQDRKFDIQPDFEFSNLSEAVDFILEQYGTEENSCDY